MTFDVIAGPGAEPGPAAARAGTVVTAGDPAAVAAAASASHAPLVLLLAAGATVPRNGLAGASFEAGALTGGATHAEGERHFGWMLAPSLGPLPFALQPVIAPAAEAGVDPLVRGDIDVPTWGAAIVPRALLLEPLPADPVAAAVELAARARAAGIAVRCRPDLAVTAPPLSADDRGRAAALRGLVARHPSLRGAHRLQPTVRRRGVEREVRLEHGRRMRARVALPALTVLVHGDGAEFAARRAREYTAAAPRVRTCTRDAFAAALRTELRVRGDRYVLALAAGAGLDTGSFDALVEALEWRSAIALAAPDAAALAAGTALIAADRVPQHVESGDGAPGEALEALVRGVLASGRAVRVPGFESRRAPRERASLEVVMLASSAPEILRASLDALMGAVRADDRITLVHAAGAETLARIAGGYPLVERRADDADPFLVGGTNRALGAAIERGADLIALTTDTVVLPTIALERLRAAFARIPALGAAFAVAAGSPAQDAAFDTAYADLRELQHAAERRAAARGRESEAVDDVATPAVVFAPEALAAVGGIAPALGVSRRGFAELIARLRAAGYAVMRCEDALVHRFDPVLSRSALAAADAAARPPEIDRAAAANGFDPAARVPFATTSSAPLAAAAQTTRPLAIALPVASEDELDGAASFVATLGGRFGAEAPLRVHVLADGELPTSAIAARLRTVLAAGARPLEATLAIRIERTDDLAAWRATVAHGGRLVVAAGHERDALRGLPPVRAHNVEVLAGVEA